MAKRESIGLVGQAAQWELLFASKQDFTTAGKRSPEEWLAVLDEIGVEAVLETVASGRLPVEIALSNRIPMMLFREWFERAVDPERLKTAMRSHAEIAVLKSQLSLAAAPETPAEAAVQKELSVRYAWVAERLHAEKWGPPQKKTEAPPVVNIVFNMRKNRAQVAGEDAKVIEAKVEGAPKPWSGALQIGSNADAEDDPPLPDGLVPRPTLEQVIAVSRPYVQDGGV